MLDKDGQDALARLSTRDVRGDRVLDTDRVHHLGEMLAIVAIMPEGTPDVADILTPALRLAGASAADLDDLDLLARAVQGSSEGYAHAKSLLDMAVRMQPAGRRPRRAMVEPQQFSARVVGG